MRTLNQVSMRIFFLLLIVFSVPALAQQYNNEWIKHNQTYYKIKVGKTGLYQIPRTLLDSYGIGATNVQNFELWRNGKLIPVYASVSSGSLPANGYLEFWGAVNDGTADKGLYRTPAFQHTDKLSLITDTAAYFLSVNTSAAGLFYSNVANDVASNSLPAETYFMHTAGSYFRSKINPGFAAVVGEYVYSSSYDKGEFWSSVDMRPSTPLFDGLTGMQVSNAVPASTLRFGASGNSLNVRGVRVTLNGTDIKDTVMDYFNDVHSSVTFPTALISSGSASLTFRNTSAISTDRMVVSYYEIDYPHTYNFEGKRNFEFRLPAKPAGYYLEITNFDFGSAAPVLLNLTTGQRMVGDISTPAMVKFAIPATATENKYVLINMESSNINTVTGLTTKNFVNFADVANQGNYLIITHPSLYVGSNGGNPIESYKNYRASAQGGGHNVKVVDINELVDQFAFGIKKHPLSIRNFIQYARTKFAVAPGNIFLIGRGMTYSDYRVNENKSDVERLNLVPTFGNPASDNILSSNDISSPVPAIPIGRLSVINGVEIEDYLEKLQEYEQVQKNAPNTLEGRSWMKNVIHITGSSDVYLGTVLCNYMSAYRQIIEDTLFGGKVHTFCKTSTNPVEQISNDKLQQLFAEGISILTYFGHSSATTLEFNLDNPQVYNNEGKYPVFFVNGCNAGNFYTYLPLRLSINESLSEKFVLAKKRGGIAFVASTHYGIVNYLNLFLNHLYGTFVRTDYGKSLGELNMDALQSVMTAAGPLDFYARLHAEEITLHGDPALKLNVQPKADYVVEESSIKINPTFISVAETNFKLTLKLTNLGKSINDSIVVDVKRQYPNGVVASIYRAKIKAVSFADSITLHVPIVATRDKGSNKITVTIDADLEVDEVSETNNTATKEFFVFEDEARPVYPYTYAVISNATQKLYASTANPFSAQKAYVMELDTTEAFNSNLKVTKSLTTSGGILEFDPGISYRDSVVYYWRVSSVPAAGQSYTWNKSSFMYINNNMGWNQSHYFQYSKNEYSNMLLDSNRIFEFDTVKNHLIVKTILFPYGSNSSNYNGGIFFEGGCGANLNSFTFVVFNTKTASYLRNRDSAGGGLYGSLPVTCPNNGIRKQMLFDFYYNNSTYRKRAMDFIDSMPRGSLFIMFNWGSMTFNSNPQFVDTWKSDTSIYGTNQSMYHKLKGIGFTQIDSFYRNIPFLFIFKKNLDGTFSVLKQRVGVGPIDLIDESVDFTSRRDSGNISSTVVGPSKSWKTIHWDGTTDASNGDSILVSVYGIRSDFSEDLVYQSRDLKKDTAIDFISAATYPSLRFKVRSVDKTDFSPYQLKHWRVLYDELPEGAIDPKIKFSFRDSLESGETSQLQVAFKNISNTNFDSVKHKLVITDENNVQQVISPARSKPLVKGDTLSLTYNIDSKSLNGRNTVFLDVNPDDDQPEQYHFNNFLFRDLNVRADRINPLLDVTFDGVHILNRDIVSAKPHIQIKLSDEAKFLLLNDTALASVQVRYPDGMIRTYSFDNDTLRFNPATSGTNNTATIDFFPYFATQYNPEGDEYQLIVRGKDRSGNRSGESEYRVAFKIINKPMISNMLNYPNPFSTSTAFVFTITGSEVPNNIKIQILTVTGKIVREITKDELGPIRIGRNITEYKWDGTDQFGQKLANGVYLYRVVTTLNGKQMEKYKSEGDDTDKYFNNGYGKMYLMR